jgi:hypothetical protein
MGKKQQVTVKQHYVPASYLARFTFGGKRSSIFYVHPVNGASVRESIPDREGFENHYHTINLPGLEPDHLEHVFEKYELPACNLFKELSANPGRPFGSDEELSTAAMFFAVQAARLPQSKEKYKKWIVKCGTEFMDKVAHSSEFRQRLSVETGVTISDSSNEELRKAVERGGITVSADKNDVILGMFWLTEAFLTAIHEMHCTILYSKGPDWFVCSDHPVGVFYKLSGSIHDRPISARTPTIELLTNMNHLYVPLAYNVALVLHKEDYGKGALWADRRMVGVVNCLTVVKAQRFICSPGPDFVCGLPNHRMGNAQETIETLRKRGNFKDE